MSPEKKTILNNIINYPGISKAINELDFKTAYSILSNKRYHWIPILTESLLDLGIDPAKYLKNIPNHYLQESYIKTYSVPNNVMIIEEAAFAYCSELESVFIPNSVYNIEKFAFHECMLLRHVTLEDRRDNHMLISSHVFHNCFSLDRIVYEGTIGSFKENVVFIRKGNESIKEVVCSDGIISFTES